MPKLSRLLIQSVALPLLLAIILIVVAFLEVNSMKSMQFWFNHSTEVIRHIEKLRMLTNDGQTDFREYRLSGFDSMKASSNLNVTKIRQELRQLEDLTSSNPKQLNNLRITQALFEKWLDFTQSLPPLAKTPSARLRAFHDFNLANNESRQEMMHACDVLLSAEQQRREDYRAKANTMRLLLVFSIWVLTILLAGASVLLGQRAINKISQAYSLALQTETRAREKSDKALALRDEFVAVASHELKTPLAALKLQIQLLDSRLKKAPDVNFVLAKATDSTAQALRQINSLTMIVDDLLDTSRIEAGKLSFHLSQTDLSTIVEDVAQRFSPSLDFANCKIALNLEHPLVGQWDARRIEQIVCNLISNVIKYAPGGPVTISTFRSGESAILTVADSGPGIPQEMQDRIFQRFEQVDGGGHAHGLGLGLYIVKNIVGNKGGTIRVESNSGRGAKFIVEIPLWPTRGARKDANQVI